MPISSETNEKVKGVITDKAVREMEKSAYKIG